MNIPNIPSASLYRFKSILGFILVILSLSFATYLIIDYNQKSISINSKSQYLNLEINNLNNDLEEIISAINPICKRNNCKCIDEKGNLITPVFEKGPPLIHYKEKELKELYNRYEKILLLVENKKAMIDINSKLLDSYLYFINCFFAIVVFVIIFGSVLLVTGFCAWRNKIQRYQDAILEAHSKRINSGIQYILPRQRKRIG